MYKIRVGQKNIKRIEVNDNGDYIELNFNDLKLLDRVKEMLEYMQDVDEITEENARKVLSDMATQIDKVFGKDTCLKVFGTVSPTPVLILDFFNQIIPLMEKFAEEVNDNNRYSADRQGNV